MANSLALSERPFILVVDDSPACVHLACGLLGNLGYQCLPATTFSQACQLVVEYQPKLALVDLVMPEGNGAILSAELHVRCPHIVTYAVSAHYPVDLDSPTYACGRFSDVLSKPLSVDSLRSLLALSPLGRHKDGGLQSRLMSLPEPQRAIFLSALIYDLDDVQELLNRARTHIQLLYCAHRLVGIFAAADASEIELVKKIEQRLKDDTDLSVDDLRLLGRLIARVRRRIRQVALGNAN